MSDYTFNPDAAARRLQDAGRDGQLLIELPLDERPATVADGYLVQAAVLDMRDLPDQSGEPVVGWKIAGASPRCLRGALPTVPLIGAIVPSRIIASGATLPVRPEAPLTLEAEVAVSFALDVCPADEPFDAATMIDGVFAAIEVVRSRFVDRKAVGQPSFAADNVGFHALVRGDALDVSRTAAFSGHVDMRFNDQVISHALAGDDRTQPFDALAFLWQEFARRGTAIPRGAVITTGTLTLPVDVAEPGLVEARVGNVRVALRLTAGA
ncbi:MAG: fumarylacetoacetate hydrolase family protein [Duganella sp.]